MRYKDPRPEVLSAFHSAIEAEDIEAVDELLKEDIDINSCNGYKETALHRACARRNLPLVIKLLEAKANPQSKNKYGQTALMSLLASDGVSTDDLAIVKKLLETDPDLVLHADWTVDMPLHAAARSERTEIMKLLLKAGANPDVQNPLGETALHQCYSVQTARLLVNAGAKVELANFRGESALDRAVSYGSAMEDMAILLLENASSSTVQATGSFLLYTTISGGDINKVSKLLTKGVNLDFRYLHGATPLHQAALSSTPAMLDLLLRNKADIRAKVTDGSTPLHYAALSGDIQKVNLLLDAGSSLMASDKHGKTALHYAALLRYPRIVNALLEAGAMQDAEDKRGRTPLHCVVRYTFQEVETLLDTGNGTARMYVYDIRQNWKAATLEVVKILLNAKSTVATNTKRGRRLRGFAAAVAKVSGLLVDAKVGVRVRDKLGKTALHYAAENSAAEIVKLLLDAGASATIRDDRGATPLHYASNYGTPDVVKLLLEANADIEARCNFSATPLLWSAMNRTNCETVTFLLEAGADINARDIDGLTALDRATEREYAGIVNIFQEYLGLRRVSIL
jgi:ankyrin repeat protein